MVILQLVNVESVYPANYGILAPTVVSSVSEVSKWNSTILEFHLFISWSLVLFFVTMATQNESAAE